MNCPGLPEIDLSQWDVLISRKDPRYPFSGSFELTDRCNLNCVHCYINKPASSVSAREKELTTSQAIEVLDQAADAGVLFLNMTGGEVMLRPDFPETDAQRDPHVGGGVMRDGGIVRGHGHGRSTLLIPWRTTNEHELTRMSGRFAGGAFPAPVTLR